MKRYLGIFILTAVSYTHLPVVESFSLPNLFFCAILSPKSSSAQKGQRDDNQKI